MGNGCARMSLAAGVAALVGTSAQMPFDLMQIEQVIGGVGGDTSAQAIQLRMRFPFECFVGQGRLYVHNAAGEGRILLINIPGNVPGCDTGDRVLIASENFGDFLDAPIAIDFTLTSLIPADYLAAGSLTFEDDFGTVYWRLSWGGDDYTGPNDGNQINDDDSPVGDFGPPFDGPLPSDGVQALLFQGPATARSTSNADDYEVTEGAAVFTNNAGDSAAVTATACPWDLNADGAVGIGDLRALFAVWGPCPGPPGCPGDFNSDGTVGVGDMLTMFALWGPCP